MPTSHTSTSSDPNCSISVLPLTKPHRKTSEDGPSMQDPATHLEDQDEAPGFNLTWPQQLQSFEE